MTVLVFEDNDVKWGVIECELKKRGLKESGIVRISNVSQFSSIQHRQIDFCIVDIRMPGVAGGAERNAGTEILSMLEYSGLNVPCMAITAFPGEAEDLRDAFAARGCIIFDFDKKEQWGQALDLYLAMSRERGRYDFLVFVALKKERDGFLHIPDLQFEAVQRHGLDLAEFELDGRSGAIILLPRMGLVNATAVVTKALENYSPRVVAMSGICAGIGDQATLGQLLVTDYCWEYQSGKWLEDAFEAEPYQVSIPQDTRLAISQLLDDPTLLRSLEEGYTGSHRPAQVTMPKLAVFTSGSAVIASEERLDSVKQQHRRVAGLDMEVFGFHRAAEMSGLKLHAFSAKVVVDKANESKGDTLHEYGSVLSAKFTVAGIRRLFKLAQ